MVIKATFVLGLIAAILTLFFVRAFAFEKRATHVFCPKKRFFHFPIDFVPARVFNEFQSKFRDYLVGEVVVDHEFVPESNCFPSSFRIVTIFLQGVFKRDSIDCGAIIVLFSVF